MFVSLLFAIPFYEMGDKLYIHIHMRIHRHRHIHRFGLQLCLSLLQTLSCLIVLFQLVEKQNVRGVISVNESYETRFFTFSVKVSPA